MEAVLWQLTSDTGQVAIDVDMRNLCCDDGEVDTAHLLAR